MCGNSSAVSSVTSTWNALGVHVAVPPICEIDGSPTRGGTWDLATASCLFAPQVLPSADGLLGAASLGEYHSGPLDALIAASHEEPSSSLNGYAKMVVEAVPIIELPALVPDGTAQEGPIEVSDKLVSVVRGALAANPLGVIVPQDWMLKG
jgi:hypothetical protein